ncbi:MAG: hypothetical protein WA989_01810, partial [Henriciella sp.]
MILAAGVLAATSAYLFLPAESRGGEFAPVSGLVMIAHAGGGLESGTYSNAREAFDASVERGFEYIEADFNWTQNGDLVLMHDWQEQYRDWFTPFERLPSFIDLSSASGAKSAAAFRAQRMRDDLTPMALHDLGAWMDQNADISIITDVKGRNLAGLAKIGEDLERHKNRFIPQIYSPDEYD